MRLTGDTHSNPLDNVEEFLSINNWVFDRMTDDELIVQLQGKACTYRLFFIWQADMSALQFCCQYDLTVAPGNMDAAARALLKINENLWMGHFDIPQGNSMPSFRHTCLLRGVRGLSGIDHIEDLVDISLAQCERYYSVFDLLARGADAMDDDLSLALMDTSGRA